MDTVYTGSQESATTKTHYQNLQDWLSDAEVSRQALSHTVVSLISGTYDDGNPELTGIFRQLEVMDAHFGALIERLDDMVDEIAAAHPALKSA